MHRITIHDIMLNNLDDLMGGNKADVFYSDPPWGPGMLKYFRTHNNQKGHIDDWMEFVKRLKLICDRHVKGARFIEMSMKCESDIVKVFGKPQARYVQKYNAGSKALPNILLCYGEVPQKDPSGLGGVALPHTVLGNLPSKPKSVLDCCVGLGMTAKAAKKLGMQVYANELNPKRASRTMEVLNFTLVGRD